MESHIVSCPIDCNSNRPVGTPANTKGTRKDLARDVPIDRKAIKEVHHTTIKINRNGTSRTMEERLVGSVSITNAARPKMVPVKIEIRSLCRIALLYQFLL